MNVRERINDLKNDLAPGGWRFTTLSRTVHIVTIVEELLNRIEELEKKTTPAIEFPHVCSENHDGALA